MNKEELLNYNIMCGAELLVNCYYDGVIEEPKPLSEWVNYVYNAITKNLFTPDYMEMGNNVCRFFSKEVIKEKTIEYLKSCDRIKEYIIF